MSQREEISSYKFPRDSAYEKNTNHQTKLLCRGTSGFLSPLMESSPNCSLSRISEASIVHLSDGPF